MAPEDAEAMLCGGGGGIGSFFKKGLDAAKNAVKGAAEKAKGEIKQQVKKEIEQKKQELLSGQQHAAPEPQTETNPSEAQKAPSEPAPAPPAATTTNAAPEAAPAAPAAPETAQPAPDTTPSEAPKAPSEPAPAPPAGPATTTTNAPAAPGAAPAAPGAAPAAPGAAPAAPGAATKAAGAKAPGGGGGLKGLKGLAGGPRVLNGARDKVVEFALSLALKANGITGDLNTALSKIGTAATASAIARGKPPEVMRAVEVAIAQLRALDFDKVDEKSKESLKNLGIDPAVLAPFCGPSLDQKLKDLGFDDPSKITNPEELFKTFGLSWLTQKGLAVPGGAASGPDVSGFVKGLGGGGSDSDDEPEAPEEERKSFTDILQGFCELVLKIFLFVMKLFFLLPILWSSVAAFIWIMIIIVILYLVIYLIFVSNPRIPLLWHSERLEDYMTEYFGDLAQAMHVLATTHDAVQGQLSGVQDVTPGAVDSVFQHLNAVTSYQSTPFAESISTYMQFRSAVSGFGFLAQRDLRNNARQFVTGEDELDCDDFRSGFVHPMDDFARSAEALSSQLEARGARLLRGYEVRVPGSETTDSRGNVTVAYDVHPAEVSLASAAVARKFVTTMPDGRVVKTRSVALTAAQPPRAPGGEAAAPAAEAWAASDPESAAALRGSDAAVAYVTALHTVRMMMEQREAIEIMYMSRRKKLTFAIWTIYYAPLMKNLFFSLGAYWKKFPKRAVKTILGTIKWWMSLGPMIAMMPCKMAFTDPEERMKHCKATLVDTFVSEPATHDEFGNERSADTQTREVIEGMFDLGGIISALSSIAAFFENIGAMGQALGEIVSGFATDPFGVIIRILSIVLGTIVGFAVMILWILLTVLMFPLLLAWVAFCCWCIAAGYLYTVWLIFLGLLLAIPYFGLWLIDMPTGGFVTRMMHCENSPGGWHSRNMASDENSFVRVFPFCLRPCAPRYTKSWTGCCCNRLPPYMPDLCPQQQVYNLSRGIDSSAAGGKFAHGAPVSFAKYHADAAFKRMTVDAKRKYLVSAFDRKTSWYARCFDTLESKDFLNRHLCSVFDQLGLDKDMLQKLAIVCSECYCDYRKNPDESNPLSSGKARLTQGWQDDAPNGGNESLCRELKRVAYDASAEESSDPGPALLRRVLVMTLIALIALLVMYSMTKSGDKMFNPKGKR